MTEDENTANEIDLNSLSLDEFYTASQGTEVLSQKSGKEVNPDYLRSLVRLGKIRARKLDKRTTLYYKPDVDNYTVEPRGIKAGRSKKTQT